MGGRAAEELVFHDPTTGAADDIEKATKLARAMVTQYGMTERLGAIKFGEDNSEPFLGRDIGHARNYSEDIAAAVDEEVKALISTAHQEAFDILHENRDVLDNLVIALLERETLDRSEVAEIFEALRRRPTRPAWTGSPDRLPSDVPPVSSPKERSRQNGEPEEEDAPIILAPGSDGDVHGGSVPPAPGKPPGPPPQGL
jgi:cell division protease FtsH